MTVNIPKAYRIERGFSTWDTLRAVQKQGIAESRNMIDQIMYEIVHDPQNTLGKENLVHAYAEAYERAKNHYDNTTSEVWNFDAAILFYEKMGRIYLVPMAAQLVSPVLSFLGGRIELQDYHYSDKQPRPPFITPQQWTARKCLWNSLVNSFPFSLDIVNKSFFYYYSPLMRTHEIEIDRANTKEQLLPFLEHGRSDVKSYAERRKGILKCRTAPAVSSEF